MDEVVVRPKYDRIATALSLFLKYLDEKDVAEVSSLRIGHVEEFLFVGFPFDEMTRAEVDDVWYSVKRFLKWLQQRKLSDVYDEYAVRKADLREARSGPSGSGPHGDSRL